MTKTPFVSKEILDTITEQFPTPFHLYDEKGIREKARALNAAFAWNKGFKEYFAVKATPTLRYFENFTRRRLWSGLCNGCRSADE
jgi:diaminopimelate decarboxylase